MRWLTGPTSRHVCRYSATLNDGHACRDAHTTVPGNHTQGVFSMFFSHFHLRLAIPLLFPLFPDALAGTNGHGSVTSSHARSGQGGSASLRADASTIACMFLCMSLGPMGGKALEHRVAPTSPRLIASVTLILNMAAPTTVATTGLCSRFVEPRNQ